MIFYDVVVVGSGPSGSILATTVKKGNPELNVLLIDKSLSYTHKIGEILLTQTMVMLNSVGILEDFHKYAVKFGWQKKVGTTFVLRDNREPLTILNNNISILTTPYDIKYPDFITADYNGKKIRHSYNVKRHEFDFCLREIAKSYGVEMLEAEVKDVNFINNSVKSIVLDSGKAIYGKVFVDASGQSAIFSRKLNSRVPILENFMGMRLSSRYAYFKGLDFNKAIKAGFFKQGANILSFSEGWAWIAALEDKEDPLVSVGIVSNKWKNCDLYQKLNLLPEFDVFGLREAIASPLNYLGEPQQEGFYYGAPDYSNCSETPFGNNWLLVGDSNLFIDPLLSQGVTLAISYGYLYGKSILSGFSENTNDFSSLFEGTYKKYVLEKEVIVKLLEYWYNPENKLSNNEDWTILGQKLAKIFKVSYNNNLQDFQFIINLENVHYLMENRSEEEIIKMLLDIAKV